MMNILSLCTLICAFSIIRSFIWFRTARKIYLLKNRQKFMKNITKPPVNMLKNNTDDGNTTLPFVSNVTGPKPVFPGTYIGVVDLNKTHKYYHSTIIDEMGLVLFE